MYLLMLTDGGAGPGDPWTGGGGAGGGPYPGGYTAPPPTAQAAYASNNIHLPHDNMVSTSTLLASLVCL